MRARMRRVRERGVAVITALLLTTLAISIVASLFWQQQVQVRSMENQRLHLQTQWILRGALDWSMLVLDTFRFAQYTGLDQAWATPLADTRLDQYIERERVEGESYDASLSGNIADACARYNLRNLADNGAVSLKQREIFGRLLQNLQLDPNLAKRVAEFVRLTQPVVPTEPDPNNPPTKTTEQGEVNLGISGVPMKLLEVDDLLAVPGITPVMVERLRPFVVVLPQATPVNVNTAPAEVLSAVVPNLSLAEANSWVVRRQQAPWREKTYFESQLNIDTANVAPNAYDVKSDWFLIDSRIRLDRAALDAEALIHRAAGLATSGGSQVVWIRQY